jgi:hypothetical protein
MNRSSWFLIYQKGNSIGFQENQSSWRSDYGVLRKSPFLGRTFWHVITLRKLPNFKRLYFIHLSSYLFDYTLSWNEIQLPFRKVNSPDDRITRGWDKYHSLVPPRCHSYTLHRNAHKSAHPMLYQPPLTLERCSFAGWWAVPKWTFLWRNFDPSSNSAP